MRIPHEHCPTFLLLKFCYELNYGVLLHGTALPGHCTGHFRRVTVPERAVMHRRVEQCEGKASFILFLLPPRFQNFVCSTCTACRKSQRFNEHLKVK